MNDCWQAEAHDIFGYKTLNTFIKYTALNTGLDPEHPEYVSRRDAPVPVRYKQPGYIQIHEQNIDQRGFLTVKIAT